MAKIPYGFTPSDLIAAPKQEQAEPPAYSVDFQNYPKVFNSTPEPQVGEDGIPIKADPATANKIAAPAPKVFDHKEQPQIDEHGFTIKDDPNFNGGTGKTVETNNNDAPKKEAAKTETKTSEPQQKSTFDEKYAPPPMDSSSPSEAPNPFAVWGEKEIAPKEDPTDPHRSLLQAIMGWNDVPYGQKWNHYLQHGLVGVSRENLENVTAMANAEKQMMGATMGQQLRANEQKRRTITSEWDKLLRDWNAGRYVGDEALVNLFYQRAQALRDQYEAEGFNPNTLTPPSINPGGFAQGFQKTLSDDREKLDWLGEWMQGIQKHIADDPNWLNRKEAQAEFDKLSEYVVVNWAQSKGAIADAEKVRAQVETMPEEDRLVFDTFMSRFFNANAVAQLHALSAKGDYSAKQTLQSLEELLGMADRKEHMSELDPATGKYVPNAKVSNLMGAAVLGYLTLIKNQANIPNDVVAAVTSYKNARDAFQEYVMQNANVDRRAVWNMALDQYNIYKSKYENKLPRLGLLFGWGATPRNLDKNLGEYLHRWQQADRTSKVMRNATLGTMPLPKTTYDPMGIGRGGAGGNVRR